MKYTWATHGGGAHGRRGRRRSDDEGRVCYEPGQSTVMHTHPREEEAIFVLEGTANMNIAGEEVVVVIMFIKANPKILRNLSDG